MFTLHSTPICRVISLAGTRGRPSRRGTHSFRRQVPSCTNNVLTRAAPLSRRRYCPRQAGDIELGPPSTSPLKSNENPPVGRILLEATSGDLPELRPGCCGDRHAGAGAGHGASSARDELQLVVLGEESRERHREDREAHSHHRPGYRRIAGTLGAIV